MNFWRLQLQIVDMYIAGSVFLDMQPKMEIVQFADRHLKLKTSLEFLIIKVINKDYLNII